MARVLKTLREGRSCDYAVKGRQTWRPHFRNLFYHKSCVNLLLFQNVYRPNRRPYPSVFDLKEKSTRYVGFQPEKLIWSIVTIIARSKTNILPHVFAVIGVVCGADTNCQDTTEEDSAKSGMSQDVTPQQTKSCNELVEHEYALRKYQTTKKGRILVAIIAHLQVASCP